MNIAQQKTDIDIVSEAKAVLDIDIKALKAFQASIDQSFADAAEMIYSCSGKIIVTGVGKSGIIARKIAAIVLAMWKNKEAYDPAKYRVKNK